MSKFCADIFANLKKSSNNFDFACASGSSASYAHLIKMILSLGSFLETSNVALLSHTIINLSSIVKVWVVLVNSCSIKKALSNFFLNSLNICFSLRNCLLSNMINPFYLFRLNNSKIFVFVKKIYYFGSMSVISMQK